MKGALLAGNAEAALAHFADSAKPKYREIFCYLGANLPTFAAGMSDLAPVYIHGSMAQYQLEREEPVGGQTTLVPYPVYFDKDDSDEWKIRTF